MTVSIRPYRPADYAVCRALWVELTEHHRRIYDAPAIGGDDPGGDFDVFLADARRAGTWVAVDGNGCVVGLTGLLLTGDGDGEIEPVVVTAPMRSHGVGRALMSRVVDEARDRGLAILSIRPVARNKSAMAVFHEFGFQTVGHVELFTRLEASRASPETGIDLHGRSYEY